MIVYLAIEDDNIAPICRGHRLRAALRQFNDRKPPVPKRHASVFVYENRAGVRPAMSQRRRHRLDIVKTASLAGATDHPGNAAHLEFSGDEHSKLENHRLKLTHLLQLERTRVHQAQGAASATPATALSGSPSKAPSFAGGYLPLVLIGILLIWF